ncbi:Tryptophan 7-halogenase [Saliniradius amylolyticus]|uniref:Tryptophan 7-halogenase n=1 Tax=Saliniradius amylolyticus TaxID=2183582 RepID=A0A2S2E2V2_9ALTE|nr:tryptophan halogenase family protein [Saliniradius amylolyticus]AWL11971.1 Tryptophan 7-halogenase [Saliniradius amylolyticus]
MTTSNTLPVITIVGGGSAGWMSAIYLNRYFNKDHKQYHIRLIESPDVGIIGVGEATVHSIRYFFAAMGLNEAELIRQSQGTLKSGILFRNWMKPKDGRTHEYFHPFESNFSGPGIDISSLWMQSSSPFQRYDEAVCTSAHHIRDGLCAKGKNSRPYTGLVPYGYHLDANLMARYLRQQATAAGVEHIEALVDDVIVENHRIRAVHTDQGTFSGDIFIDCSGFKGLLINQLEPDNWRSFKAELPCDRAVAVQTKYEEDTVPKPYTVATALSNGWAWEIDLVNRRGNGYVYDSNRLTPEQAEAELLRHIDVTSDDIIKTNHLAMQVGCRNKFWSGNCIAIGLSGGFIEPLESTGLHVINLGVRLLASHLSGSEAESVAQAYNQAMNGIYDDLKQFIVLHYCLTDRDDTPFWQHAQTTASACPGLERKLELWQHKVCEYFDLAGGYSSTFTDENYRYVLYGMERSPSLSLRIDPATAAATFEQCQSRIQTMAEQLLPHHDYLASIHQA